MTALFFCCNLTDFKQPCKRVYHLERGTKERIHIRERIKTDHNNSRVPSYFGESVSFARIHHGKFKTATCFVLNMIVEVPFPRLFLIISVTYHVFKEFKLVPSFSSKLDKFVEDFGDHFLM